jgi:Polysaccharide lyase
MPFERGTSWGLRAAGTCVLGVWLALVACSSEADTRLPRTSGGGGAAGGGETAGGGHAGESTTSGGASNGTGGEGNGSGGNHGEAGAGAMDDAGAGGSTPDGGTSARDASSRAGLIWYADPELGNAAFKKVEMDSGCTITIVDDPVYGKVRKFNRPPGTNRCEAHGAAGFASREGDLIFMGMRYKIVAPMNLTVTSIMQWKTYDTPGHPNTMNYPVLLRPNSGRLVVETQKPGSDTWYVPTPLDTWFTIVLAINESYDQKIGYIELWYNGERQTFNNGEMRFYCQTLDGGYIDPKWGMYGTNSSPKPQSATFLADLRIASDYASAAPESY